MGQLFWNPPTKWQKHYQYGVKHHFGVIIEESKHREVFYIVVQLLFLWLRTFKEDEADLMKSLLLNSWNTTNTK